MRTHTHVHGSHGATHRSRTRRCGAPCSSGAPHTARPRSLAHAGPAASRGSEHALLHCDARMLRPHHATRRRLAMALAQPHWRPVPCTYADHAGPTRVRRKAADGALRHRHRDLREVRAAVSECALSRTSAALASCYPVCFPCTHCARYAQVGDRAGSAVASAARAPRPLAHREHREHVSHVRPRAPTHWHCLVALQPCPTALTVRLPCMPVDGGRTRTRRTVGSRHRGALRPITCHQPCICLCTHLSMHMPLLAHMCTG